MAGSDSEGNALTGIYYASSQCQVQNGGLVWDIEKFLLFNTPGKSYSSPEFKAGGTKWKLNVFAAGELSEQNETSNFLGLYLHSMNDKTLNCKYSVTLFIGDQKIEEISDCDEFGKSDNWGWGQLCPLDTLQKLMQENNSTLRIRCDLEVFVKRQNVTGKDNATQSNTSVHTSTEVTKHFNQMLESGAFSDVTFICKGEKFPAHKAVLSSRSLVFNKMFSSGMTEAKDGIVTIEECEVHIFKEVLNFLYTGSIKNETLVNNVQELLAQADKYDLTDLRSLCDKVLLQQLTPHNAASILLLSDTYHSLALKSQVMALAVSNFEAVITSPEFVDLCKANPALVAEFNIAHAERMKDYSRPSKKKKT